MNRARRIWLWFSLWRILPSLIAFRTSRHRTTIDRDLQRWIRNHFAGQPHWLAFCGAMLYYPAFRNLFYYRIKQSSVILACLLKPLLPEMNTLFVYAERIGPGLYIQHGFSTIITAKSIGEDCWINQQVTIGYNRGGEQAPVIGDRVTITAGAKIIGDCNIGDGSIIGANAVVVKNVPPGCTVVGVPGRIIRRDGVRVDEAL